MLAHSSRLALLLSVSVVTGCAVGPDYTSPEVAVSRGFLGQEDVAPWAVQSKADLQGKAKVGASWEPDVFGGLRRARENSLAAYQGGVVSLIEVLDADSSLLPVRDAISSVRALGGGWDERNASSISYGALQ